MKLSAHRIERSRSVITYTNISPNLVPRLLLKLLLFDPVAIDIFEELYEELARLILKSTPSPLASKESAYRLSEPSPTTAFEPAEMTTKRGSA